MSKYSKTIKLKKKTDEQQRGNENDASTSNVIENSP